MRVKYKKILLTLVLGGIWFANGIGQAETYTKTLSGDYSTDSEITHYGSAVEQKVPGNSDSLIYRFMIDDSIHIIANGNQNIGDDKSLAQIFGAQISSGKVVEIKGDEFVLTVDTIAGDTGVITSTASAAQAGLKDIYGLENSGDTMIDGTSKITVNATGGTATSVGGENFATGATVGVEEIFGVYNTQPGILKFLDKATIEMNFKGGTAVLQDKNWNGANANTADKWGNAGSEYSGALFNGGTLSMKNLDILISAENGIAEAKTTSARAGTGNFRGIQNQATGTADFSDLVNIDIKTASPSSSYAISETGTAYAYSESIRGIENFGTATFSKSVAINMNLAAGNASTGAPYNPSWSPHFQDAYAHVNLVDGIYNGGGNLHFKEQVNIQGSGTGGTATSTGGSSTTAAIRLFYGLQNGGGTTRLNKGFTIALQGQGGTATTKNGEGNANASSTLYGVGVSGGSIQVNGPVKIDILSTGGKAETFTGIASSTGGGIGIYTDNDGMFTANDSVEIRIKGVGGENNQDGTLTNGNATVYGVAANKDSVVDFRNDVKIVAEADSYINTGLPQGTETTRSLYALGGGTILVNQEGNNRLVQLTGDINVDADSEINAALDQSDSFFQGLVANSGTLNLGIENGAIWRPTTDGSSGVINSNFGSTGAGLILGNSGMIDMSFWHNQAGHNPDNQYRALDISGNATLENGAIYKVNSDVVNLRADKINFLGPVTGSGTQYVQIGYDPAIALVTAPNTQITASPMIDVVTGLTGVESVTGLKNTVSDSLLNYEIMPAVIYDPVTGVASIGSLSIFSPGVSPGMVVASDSQVAMRSLWVQQSNLMNRMGDIRLNPQDSHQGAWARVYSGKVKDSDAYRQKFSQKYTGVEAGVDKEYLLKSGKIYAGIMGSYITSSPDYYKGSGDLKGVGGGIYGTWISDKGDYVDLVFRASHFDNEYKFHDLAGTHKGDYNAWAYALSAEYGHRFKISNQCFIEPQAQLTFGKIQSSSYTDSRGARIHQDSADTSSGRLGVLVGYNFSEDKQKQDNVYLRASVIKDFGSGGKITASDQTRTIGVAAAGNRGTRLEMNLGGNVELSKRLDIYGELTKSFGGESEIDWQVDGGIRYRW